MRLPPGVSQADFASAIAALEPVVGKEWVFTSDEDLDLYRDAYSPFLNEPEERIASAAVAPSSTEQVQQIVRIANRYHVPLYAISTGKNLGYGGSAPAYSGADPPYPRFFPVESRTAEHGSNWRCICCTCSVEDGATGPSSGSLRKGEYASR